MLRLFLVIGRLILDLVETIITALLVFVIIYLFLFQPHQVKGNSMQPNFEDGEYLLTNKVTYRINKPKRGEVVIFESPQNKDFDYIKRIIGLPGEKVKIVNGKIFINGSVLDESAYLADDVYTQEGSFLPENEEVDVSENQYFVVGDNRSHSSDSREWGFISVENIIGKTWVRYWPPSRAGLLPTIAW